MTQSNPLRVGLIGAGGRWGPRAHVPALKGVPEAELYAVCTAHADTARPLPLRIIADEVCYGTVSPIRRVLQAMNPHAVLRLRQLLRTYRPDIVHVKMFLTQLSPLILPLLRSVPSLLHVINYNLVCPINTKILPDGSACHFAPGRICHATGCISWAGVARAAVQRMFIDLSVFDRIIANSRWVAERLRGEGIRVDGWVENGIPVRAQRPALGAGPVVGFAGRLIRKYRSVLNAA